MSPTNSSPHPLRELLDRDNQELFYRWSYEGLTDNDCHVAQQRGYQVYRGKVRDVLLGPNEVYLIQSDRLTAFDRRIGTVPLRGMILTHLTDFWFKTLSSRVSCSRWERLSDRVIRMERLEPVKVEIVVRGFMAGSLQRAYLAGERQFCGVVLPEGLSQFEKFSHPIITPTSKAPVGDHDEPLDREQIIQQGLCTKEEWQQIVELALAAFSIGSSVAERQGWLLVDTKYEIGRTPSGELKIMDEVHTPDSSRFWRLESYQQRISSGQQPEMFDKEVIRDWLIRHGFSGVGAVPSVPEKEFVGLASTYLKVAEDLIGAPICVSTTTDWQLETLPTAESS